MTFTDDVRAAFAGREIDEGFGPVTVDVPADEWLASVRRANDLLGLDFFDFLTAVDELADGFRIVCHLARRGPGFVDHLVLRTLVPREGARVASVADVFHGARWHQRETHEMFGIDFTDASGEPLVLAGLLLPENFEGHPLRKEFVLASRVAKPFPGAKEPGESDHDKAPSRRRMRPPGVPEPEQWGPRPADSEAPDPLAWHSAAPAARRPVVRRRPTDESPDDE